MLATDVQELRNLVYVIHNQQVMLDFDLAVLYGYEVRALNQQVKRNIARFPEDFMFQLTKEEVETVKSQIVISPESNFYSGQEGGRRKPPFAFTEQRIYMLATVLKNHVIYKGQKFEADKAYIDIYQRAKKSIYVVDDYVNIKTLHLLSHKKSGVAVTLFTENGHGRRGYLTASEVTDFDM